MTVKAKVKFLLEHFIMKVASFWAEKKMFLNIQGIVHKDAKMGFSCWLRKHLPQVSQWSRSRQSLNTSVPLSIKNTWKWSTFYHSKISLKLLDSRNSFQTKNVGNGAMARSDMDTETQFSKHIQELSEIKYPLITNNILAYHLVTHLINLSKTFLKSNSGFTKKLWISTGIYNDNIIMLIFLI